MKRIPKDVRSNRAVQRIIPLLWVDRGRAVSANAMDFLRRMVAEGWLKGYAAAERDHARRPTR